MIPFVLGLNTSESLSTSSVKEKGSISQNIGLAPAKTTELGVAAKVNEGTIISSPCVTPLATIARWSPDVPELTATTGIPSTIRTENSSSNFATSGPWAKFPERRTRATANCSRAPINGFAIGIKTCALRSKHPRIRCTLGPSRDKGSGLLTPAVELQLFPPSQHV